MSVLPRVAHSREHSSGGTVRPRAQPNGGTALLLCRRFRRPPGSLHRDPAVHVRGAIIGDEPYVTVARSRACGAQSIRVARERVHVDIGSLQCRSLTQAGFAQTLTEMMTSLPGGRPRFLAGSVALFVVLGSVLEELPASSGAVACSVCALCSAL